MKGRNRNEMGIQGFLTLCNISWIKKRVEASMIMFCLADKYVVAFITIF